MVISHNLGLEGFPFLVLQEHIPEESAYQGLHYHLRTLDHFAVVQQETATCYTVIVAAQVIYQGFGLPVLAVAHTYHLLLSIGQPAHALTSLPVEMPGQLRPLRKRDRIFVLCRFPRFVLFYPV